MSRQERQVHWPYREFNKVLDQKMIEAGISITAKGRPSSLGRPNTMEFEEITGIGSDRISRWRSGYQQPTIDSLRAVARGLAPRSGADPAELQYELEVAAGRRSGDERPKPPETPASLEGKIRRARRILKSESLTPEQRARYQSMLAGYDRAYEGMLDHLLEEFERDIQGARDDQ